MKANGSRIREAREAKGMGIRSLAEKANVHRGYLSKLERGLKGATPETLGRIADVLEKPVTEFTEIPA